MDAHLPSRSLDLAFRPGFSDANLSSTAPLSSPNDDDVDGAGLGLPLEGPSSLPEQLHSHLEPPLQPFPQPAAPPYALPTPDEPQPNLVDLDFASALPDEPLPTPPIAKAAHNLRLPSFDLLGIAAPHPDRLPLTTYYSFSSLGAGPLSKPGDPLHALSPALGRHLQFDGADDAADSAPARAVAHIEQLVPIVTPESELGTLNWGAFVNVRTAGVGSPPSSDPGVSPSLATTAGTSSAVPPSSNIVPLVVGMSDALGQAAWIDEVERLISKCRTVSSDPVQMAACENFLLPPVRGPV